MARKIRVGSSDRMTDDGSIVLFPIGIIHSPLDEKTEDIPFQSFTSEVEGTIEVDEEYQEGLDGIEGFSHLTIIYYLHKNRKSKIRTVPLLEKEERGIFGTRSPSRPNHIGVSTVKLLSRDGRILKVKGLDMFDGTPVLDIKPYVPKVDLVRGVENKWLLEKLDKIDNMDDEQKGSIQKQLRDG